MRRRFLLVVAVALVAGLAFGPGGRAAPATPVGMRTVASPVPGLPGLTITATDSGFTLPALAPAGLTLVTLVNVAAQPREADLAQLPTGSGLATFRTALATPAAMPVEAGVVWVGGPGLVPSGGHAQAIVNLTPGSYAVTALGGDPSWMRGFTVVAAPGAAPAATEPAADGAIILQDGALKLAARVPDGTHRWLVSNTGQQPHQVRIARVPSGATLAQVRTLLAGPGLASPVAGGLAAADLAPIGGLGVLSPGQMAWTVLGLTPGRYVAYCDLPDPTHPGESYAQNGMLALFDVSGAAPPVGTSLAATAPSTATTTPTVAAAPSTVPTGGAAVTPVPASGGTANGAGGGATAEPTGPPATAPPATQSTATQPPATLPPPTQSAPTGVPPTQPPPTPPAPTVAPASRASPPT